MSFQKRTLSGINVEKASVRAHTLQYIREVSQENSVNAIPVQNLSVRAHTLQVIRQFTQEKSHINIMDIVSFQPELTSSKNTV